MKHKRLMKKSRADKIGIVFPILCILIVVAMILAIVATSTNTAFIDEDGNVSISLENFLGSLKRTPTPEDLEDLKQCFQELVDYLDGQDSKIEQISECYDKELDAKVCRKAYINFNQLEELYEVYIEELKIIQEHFTEFETKYEEYERMLGNIPRYAVSAKRQADEEFVEVTTPMLEFISEQKELYNDDEEEVTALYESAKKYAEDFKSSVKELYCKLAYAESGNCSAFEQCCVLNVADNRAESSYFEEDDIFKVVYAPGQYSTTWDGGFEKTPSSSTRAIVEEYITGHIDTGMPADVVYQATFPQGSRKDDPWWHSSSGHYFCYH